MLMVTGLLINLIRQLISKKNICSKKPHLILAAIRKKQPEGWTRVNVTLIQQQLKEKEKEVNTNTL